MEAASEVYSSELPSTTSQFGKIIKLLTFENKNLSVHLNLGFDMYFEKSLS